MIIGSGMNTPVEPLMLDVMEIIQRNRFNRDGLDTLRGGIVITLVQDAKVEATRKEP